MGAIAYQDGTAFRVWAPHADHVLVTGSFNKWSKRGTPLAHEANGYWSADITQARPGDEYKFVIRRGAHTFVRTDPYAKAIMAPFNNGLIVNGHLFPAAPENRPPSPFQPPQRHELVIYELHVGTFNKKRGAPVGNFQGVMEKLPYLNALGVTAIELMPIKEFAGDYSWGYNPAHPFAIARAYGGREGLKELIKAAHAYGIAVIVDVVYNHFGPDNLSLWQFDGWHENGKGGVYFYNDWRSKTPWADTRPDYGRPEVRQYLRDNVLLWLEEYEVDGLRWDATAHIRNVHGRDGDPGSDIPEGWTLMQQINDEVKARYPAKIAIAEDLQGNAWLTKASREGGAGFDSQWDARFVHTLRGAVIALDDTRRDMNGLRDAIVVGYNGDAFERVIYSESHDEVANGRARVPEEIAPGSASNLFAKKRATLAAAVVFTAPGIPMIFQGQEFLEDGWFDDRDPLDWAKATANAGIVNLYRDLIRLRRNGDGRTGGLAGRYVNVYHVNNADKLIAFHRWDQGGPGDDVVVVANFANRVVKNYRLGFPRAGQWRLRFNSDRKLYDARFGDYLAPHVEAVEGPADSLHYRASVSLGPYSAVIFSQD
jgi:1,4-alpha-glucan branching enzyme